MKNKLEKEIVPVCNIHMVKRRRLWVEVLRVEQRRRPRRGRVRLNQYLESQDDHEMIRLTLLH